MEGRALHAVTPRFSPRLAALAPPLHFRPSFADREKRPLHFLNPRIFFSSD
jgi:hypothetical protein